MRSLLQRLWPQRFLAQVSMLVFLALFIAQGLTIWLFWRGSGDAIANYRRSEQIEQIRNIVEIFDKSPSDFHDEMLVALDRLGLRLEMKLSPQLPIPQSAQEKRLAADLLGLLDRAAPGAPLRLVARHTPNDDFYRPPVFLKWMPRPPWLPRPEEIQVEILLATGSWLQIIATSPAPTVVPRGPPVVFALLAFASVMAVLVLQLRNITRPLRDLSQAADGIGHGNRVSPVLESGPVDIRSAIRAFNAMNKRVDNFVAERTRMLAALSHDLRTPITSMRLRLEMMEETPEQAQLISSLNEMQQMTESTLAFIRESRDAEATQRVDVTALLASICDDYSDLGRSVTFDYQSPILLTCRPLSLKRALRNIIENAVIYGEHATVTVEALATHILIVVQDQGPGLDTALGSNAFEPYKRGETSRNRNTGGIGLGLSITRQIVANHGGTITLTNTFPGMKVEVQLPMPAQLA